MRGEIRVRREHRQAALKSRTSKISLKAGWLSLSSTQYRQCFISRFVSEIALLPVSFTTLNTI